MSDIVVADSSCLIGLSRIEQLEILRNLFQTIVIPEAVHYEVVVCGKGKPGAAEVEKADWIQKQKATNQLAVETLRLNLGAGESESIILAKETEAKFVILDDLKARQAAEELGVSVIGTAAILQKAEEKKIIESFQDILQELQKVGFYYFV
jgi:predicted nucleic acid-binding protein